MILNVSFKETDKRINAEFKETYRVSDGNVEAAYTEGYTQGFKDAQPTETINIVANGTYDMTLIKTAYVDVPIPAGYLKPEGTFTTNIEGLYDVTPYAEARFVIDKEQISVIPTKETQTRKPPKNKFFSEVVVEPIPEEYIIPAGEFSVDENGSYDITEYASININVPIPEGYLVPEGTFAADVEGSYDVTPYAEAVFTVQKEH